MQGDLDGERGQSLIGILIVAAIGILIAWLFLGNNTRKSDNGSRTKQVIQKSREAQSRQELRTLRQAINRYRSKTGAYPSDLETLVDEGYVSGGALRNAQGNRYSYNPQTGAVGK